MKPDEKDWLEKNTKEGAPTCEACGHLNFFHNFHCCDFCRVEGCPCKWGEIEPVK